MSIAASSTVVRSSRGRRRRDDTNAERAGRHVAMAGGAEQSTSGALSVSAVGAVSLPRRQTRASITWSPPHAIMAFMQMAALAALLAPSSGAWVASLGVARPVAAPCAAVRREPRCSVPRLQGGHDDGDEDDEELTDAEVDTSGKIIERVPAALRGASSVPMAGRSIFFIPPSALSSHRWLSSRAPSCSALGGGRWS